MNIFSATGNLGKDCRVGQAGNSTVCNFNIAVKSGYGDNAQTLWVDCALWGKQAESKLPQYLLKGQQVAVSGELGQREHEGKTYLTLNVNSVDLVGGKSENSGQSQQAPQQRPAQQPVAMDQQVAQQQQIAGSAPVEWTQEMDDDIPFAPIGLQYSNSYVYCI